MACSYAASVALPAQWYAVRCLFRSPANRPWGPHDLRRGESAYEERITLWHAASADDAIERAGEEAEAYATDVEAEYLGLAQSYRLTCEPAEGAEVFSLIRKSDLGPTAYLDGFFNTGSEYQLDVNEAE